MTACAQTVYPDRLETARLVLRAPEQRDVPTIARLANNRTIHAMTAALPYPYEHQHAVAFVNHIARTDDEWAYAITLHDDTLIGVIGLHTDNDPCEIGYWLGEPYWGKGYATEAASALAKAALLVMPVLASKARTENMASRAVLEKIGFQRIGETTADCGQHKGVAMVTYCLDRAGTAP